MEPYMTQFLLNAICPYSCMCPLIFYTSQQPKLAYKWLSVGTSSPHLLLSATHTFSTI